MKEIVRCKHCDALLRNHSEMIMKCPVCNKEFMPDNYNREKKYDEDETQFVGDPIDCIILHESPAQIDALFGSIMDEERKKHQKDISVGTVPLDSAERCDFVLFGKLVWQVIGIENGKKLLLSKECMHFDYDWIMQEDSCNSPDYEYLTLADIPEDDEVDYEQRQKEIRKYFVKYFRDKYFSEKDCEKIEPHCITIKKNDNSVAHEFDSVFLLNKEETEKYIPMEEKRISTKHVLFYDVECAWALRSDYESMEYQSIVDENGEFAELRDGWCEWFRPAVWVK